MKKSTESQSESSETTELTHQQKYRGLIERSFFKNFRDNLFRYFDYIYTMASSYHFLSDVFNIVIFVQQCIMAFFPFDQVLWPHNKLLGRIFTIFSVAAFICPISVNSITHFIVVLLIYILLLIFYIFFFSNLFVFLKMSKVSSLLVSIFTIHLNFFQPYLINMISSHLGRDIHYIIENDERIPHIVNLILGIILLVLLVTFQTYILSPSLTFRPQVTHIMYSKYSKLYNCSYIFIFFLTTLGGFRGGIVGLIMSYITIIPAIIMIIISFKQHLWANIRSMCLSQSFSIIFCIFIFVLPILSYKKIEGNEIIILVFILIVFILIFVFKKLAEKQKDKALILLNEVSDDENKFNSLSYSKIVALLRYGFDNGHPLCHTWKLFELSFEKFPYDYGIVLMYTRYAAIYSNDSNALQIAVRFLKKMKHGSLELKYVLFQVQSLLQHRERGLSKTLKRTLSKIQDKTEKCRGLMRYTWECVIRGNVVELENLSTQLKRNEEEILREYNQLWLVYPNNPYVASSFSTYLHDIMCNDKEAAEKHKIYRLLRTGAWSRTERSYYFAIRHISTLPTEEQHSSMIRHENYASTNNNNETHSASSVSTVSAIADFNDGEEETTTQKRYIESMVNSVKLPTMRYGPILIIFSVCLLMPVIIIPELVVIYLKTISDEKSLNILKSSSLINMFMTHVAFYTFQYGLSSLGYTTNLSKKWNEVYLDDDLKGVFADKKPHIYLIPDEQSVLNMIEYLRVVLTYFNSELSEFAQSGFFKEPLDIIFDSKLLTRSYNETNNYAYMNASMEHIVTYTQGTAVQIATKLNKESILNTTGYWSIIKNSPEFYEQYDQFDLKMIKSVQNMLDNHIQDTQIMVGCSTIPGFLIALGLIIFLTVQMEKEKRQLFRSFKAIPKSAVSAIVQKLNAQSGKETQTKEYSNVLQGNAQEENALRVLSTSVDHGFGWIGRSWKIIVILIIFLIVSICSMVFLNLIPSILNSDLIQLAPLYHEISSIHTQFMVVLITLIRNSLAYKGDKKVKLFPYENYPDDYYELLNISQNLLDKVIESAHILRFGDKEIKSNGITTVGDPLINILSGHKKTNYLIPKEDIAILEMCSYDIAIQFMHRMFSIMVINLKSNINYYYPTHKKFSMASIWLLDTSYMQYVVPSFDALDKAVESRCKNYRSSEFLLPLVIFVIIMIIIGIILIPIYQQIGETAEWTLKLLLFCDPSVVLQSKDILKILSNDFSGNDINETDEKSNFYESVVSNLLDGVIFMSNDLIIRSANNSVMNVIGKDPHKIVGMTLKDLFISPQGQEASLRSFYQAVDGMMNCLRSPSIELEVEVMKGNEPVTLLLSMTAISANGEVQTKPVNSEGLAILVLSMKDMTSTVVARTLLQEENKKNENLLSMILPPIIVKQLQKGEPNICFSVQSASIVFMDIVSFTPWCGANKATYIMSTLNKLFLYFDTALKKLDKMTKIKCIGDCYMCAGGIFDEVNQPAEHARQAITFGLEAIKCVERVNVELHESLRIRVGCNTGGPIVAGVLGIEKPTFDILGPDINLGAMMEHHGVPMHVHIPQHVYDLGVYNYFVIKERGDVDVKGKMYHTYVVSGYANDN